MSDKIIRLYFVSGEQRSLILSEEDFTDLKKKLENNWNEVFISNVLFSTSFSKVTHYEVLDWIECAKELPEAHEYVLVFAKMSGINEPCPISIAKHDGDQWVLLFEGENNASTSCDLTCGIDIHEIIHWMPLPKSP